MKYCTLFFLTFLLSVGQLAYAQSTPEALTKDANGQYYFESVKTVPGIKKDVMYKAIKDWARKNLKSSDKITYDDETFENINTTAAVSTSSGTVTEFKLNIDIKDEKYRFTATSPIWHGFGKTNPLGDFSGLAVPGFQKKKIINAYEDAMVSISKSLEQTAKNANAKSDW